MAKFVKLENGAYLNVDQVITIEDHVALTFGFDFEWEPHLEELTDNDLKRILAATNSDNDDDNPSQDPNFDDFDIHTPSQHVIEVAIEALREQAAQYQDIESKLNDKRDAGELVGQDIADVKTKLKEIWSAEKDLGVFRSQLELGLWDLLIKKGE